MGKTRLTYEFFKEFCNVYFTKLLEGHRVSTNIDINEKTMDGKFGANGTSLRFTCKNMLLYLWKMKLSSFWMYFTIKFFFNLFCYWWKKSTATKNLPIYFGHHHLAFLNRFLNILNKNNVLIFNKYNHE